MAKQKVPDGVCQSCGSASTCCLVTASAQAVQQCEEFDPGEIRKPTTANSGFDEKASVAKTASEYSDLCSDCENRQGCGLREAEGGVWHCEEYR